MSSVLLSFTTSSFTKAAFSIISSFLPALGKLTLESILSFFTCYTFYKTILYI